MRLMRFMRFAVVGILNTLIDFGVLNVLLWLDDFHFGWRLVVYNGLVFAAASGNSYVLNKRWTFDDPQPFAWDRPGFFLFYFDRSDYQLFGGFSADFAGLLPAGPV